MTTFLTIVLALITAQIIIGAIAVVLVMNPSVWKWYTKKVMKAMEDTYKDYGFEKEEL